MRTGPGLSTCLGRLRGAEAGSTFADPVSPRRVKRIDDHLESELCGYCGAGLDARYYFCTRCAVPYKSEESVLPKVRPPYLTIGGSIARQAPMVWRMFWTYVAVIVAASVVPLMLSGGDRPELQLVIGSLILLSTTVFYACFHWKALVMQLERPGFDRPAAWLALLAVLPLGWLNLAYHDLVPRVLAGAEDDAMRELTGGMDIECLVILLCVTPAVVEEIAFRGLVQHWLQLATRPLVAVALSAALFTALHFSIVSAPMIFALGCLLGWAKWRTGSLYPSILVHFTYNAIAVAHFR